MDLTQIYGNYYFIEEDDSIFTNEFFLNIFPFSENKIKFDLEMVTNGGFGKIGKNWLGIGVFRSDHFAMIIEKELDWAFTNKDASKTIFENKHFESLPLEIYPYEKQLILYHKKIDKKIHLKKIVTNIS